MEQVAYGALETPIHSDALLLQTQIDLYQTLDENPQLLQESEILECLLSNGEPERMGRTPQCFTRNGRDG